MDASEALVPTPLLPIQALVGVECAMEVGLATTAQVRCGTPCGHVEETWRFRLRDQLRVIAVFAVQFDDALTSSPAL